MFFIGSFWLGVIIHAAFVAGVVFGIEQVKRVLLKTVEEEAKTKAGEARPRHTSDEERLLHWSGWRQLILAEHNVRAVFTGFVFTVLAALIGFQGSYSFTRGQLWLLVAATVSLFVQVVLSLWVVRNDREAAFKYISQQEIHWSRFQLSLFDNKVYPWLQRITVTSFLLVILLIGHRAYGQAVVSRVSENKIQQVQEETSELRIKNSELSSTNDKLFDIARRNSDLLQDIQLQADGALRKTYQAAQSALRQIAGMAAEYEEP